MNPQSVDARKNSAYTIVAQSKEQKQAMNVSEIANMVNRHSEEDSDEG
jgi:hypothetical protein